jgi:hypothetical protein
MGTTVNLDIFKCGGSDGGRHPKYEVTIRSLNAVILKMSRKKAAEERLFCFLIIGRSWIYVEYTTIHDA